MEQMVRRARRRRLIVVAPPKTLAELRNAFHPDVKACIVAEINKDLTKHPSGRNRKASHECGVTVCWAAKLDRKLQPHQMDLIWLKRSAREDVGVMVA